MKDALVVGLGNTLRGDDGLGPAVVEGLRDLAGSLRPDVRTMALPQLDVTLALEMAGADLVLFVDARADGSDEPVRVERLEPAAGRPRRSHSSHLTSLPELLRLARDWFGASPTCYAVMPKGYDFSLSETLSDRGRLSAADAVKQVVALLAPR